MNLSKLFEGVRELRMKVPGFAGGGGGGEKLESTLLPPLGPQL